MEETKMNKQELIERYEKFKTSKKKMTSVDLVLKDLRSLDEPEPLPFKLKDVVRRIRGFDPTTQTRWLNDILKELGNDYGSVKYREGYEQGKFEGEWVGNQLKDADKVRKELNKAVISQFAADWIEYCKVRKITLAHALYHSEEAKNKSVFRWLFEDLDNQDTFARAWLDGYEVEKEKRYVVKVKGMNEECEYLVFGELSNTWKFRGLNEFGELKKHHTRKELEEAGFGWVFDCPGIEIEEVEE
jgi:phage protein